MADRDHTGVIRTNPFHCTRAQPKYQADDPLTNINAVIPGIEVARESDSGQRWEKIMPVWHARNTLHQDCHLFVICAQASFASIAQGIGIEGAGVDQFNSPHEVIQTGFRISLVRAKYAAILSGEGITKAVF